MYAHGKLHRVSDTMADGVTVEPLSLIAAKRYLRVEIEDDDDLIADMIAAARMYAEQQIERSFVTTTWRLTLDNINAEAGPAPFLALPYMSWLGRGGIIRLPMPPLIEVTAITYRDFDGSATPVDLDSIGVSGGTPGEIAWGGFGGFPFLRPGLASTSIEFKAGYGPDPKDVPRNVVQAIRMMVASMYENRSVNVPASDWVINLLNASAWGHYV